MGGAVGPIAFVATWARVGATTPGYDATRTTISRLAATGAPGRAAMTAGLVALAGGMGLYAAAVRGHRGPAWALAAANAATTLAVAALPLGSGVDAAHGVAAALGYATLAAIPLLSASSAGSTATRAAAVGFGAASAVCLAASAVVDRAGLLQRIGLTVAQAWIVGDALRLATPPG